ncbi:MAG: hypothetical protein OEZ31_04295 [Nitrospirota bacterium]|nr:hypothetical protein [Nitrospirota bacterium]
MGLKGPNPVLDGIPSAYPKGIAQNHLWRCSHVVDYQKRYSIATKMNDRGKISEQVRLSNDPQTLLRYYDAIY